MACSSVDAGKVDEKSLSDQLLNCPLCLKAYTTPRMLPCLHSFCESCIHTHIVKAAENVGNTSSSSSIDCPLCEEVSPSPAPDKPVTTWARELPVNNALLPQSLELENESNKLCDNCLDLGKSTTAQSFCQNCNQFQCRECVEIHPKIAAMRSHMITGMEDALAQRPAVADLGNVEYCAEHPNKTIKFYCESHKRLCCSSCAIVDHRKCSSVVEVKKVGRELKSKARPQKLDRSMEALEAQLGEVTGVLEKDLSNIIPQTEDIVKKVKNIRSRVVRIFDDLVQQVSGNCDQLGRDETAEINNRIASQNSLKAGLASARILLESVVKHGTETQLFITLHKLEAQLDHYSKRVRDTRDSVSTVKVQMDVDQTVEALIKATKPLVRVSVNKSKVEMDNQSDFEPSTPIVDCVMKKLPLVTLQSWYSGAVYMPDGRLVVTDGTDNMCCLLSDSYTVTASVKLPTNPRSLAVMGRSEVAVVTPDTNQIHMVALDTTMTLTRTIPFQRKPRCICSAGETLLAVGWEKGFSLITFDGTETAYIETDSRGQTIKFSDDDRITVDYRRSRVYRSCGEDRSVHCYSLAGQFHFAYSDGLSGPAGVALDRDGNVYVCSCRSHHVHQLSPDGRRLSVLDPGMKYPFTVCFTPSGDEMVVMTWSRPSKALKVRFVPAV